MSRAFKAGDIVVGVHFVTNTELNGCEATVLREVSKEEYEEKYEEEYKRPIYEVEWEHGDVDFIFKGNLKLRDDDGDSGEGAVLGMFKLTPNKFNFEFYEELRDEMARERVEELETTE